MTAAIRAEFRKFFTTRMWWGLAIAIFLAGIALAVAFGFIYTLKPDPAEHRPMGTPLQIANSVYTAGLGVGYLLTLTIGVMQIGSEYRHKTITSTFLGTPRRARVMGAKVIALLGIGAIYGLISLAGSVLAGAIVLHARGYAPFPEAGVFRTLALSLLVLGLWALIGLGAGILIPNQVAALLISVGVAWIVEPLAGFGLGFWSWGRDHIVPYLPSQATSAMVSGVSRGGGGQTVHELTWWGGALMLAAYAAVMAGFGSWRTVRSDIS
ncbi:ABC-type transport system involved in multi-copper enzyme maturation permease subunit [Phycicoccus badiiscoriae]|uniref:ABC-type transport system involved in multi-copper enzyme maturation permease subunit n=1 Tax=Pedococcus badiiscoriae TaxID=642776 RepID=A0A852WBN1_9MICO|nr:ABC transporter permease [Pedococcus badiiscoriae]NYG06060.1 ABC-type transport system involved in multi-copper enzyme maturation permease subunit [Pedococcus badiiscoriae]